MKRIIADVLILGVLSLTLGFGMNAVRGSKRLDPTKNYFEKAASKPARPPADPAPEAAPPVTVESTSPKPAKKLEHDYQEIQFEELSKVFNDPATRQGLNIFVDARKEDLYAEAHIPGAMHCDPYQVGEHIDDVLHRANGVERVIVYCSGGDCEDSIFLCRELINAGIAEDIVYLYPGGIKEWTANDMPVDAGSHD